jgi:uncharacterized damage-inducible protein DinB
LENRKYYIEFGDDSDHAQQYLLGIIRDTRQTTLKLVDKLAAGEIDWQYMPGWNTIGALLDHIVAVGDYFRIVFIEDRKLSEEENSELEPALDMGVHLPKLIGIKTIDEYKSALLTSHHMTAEALSRLTYNDFVVRRPEYDENEGCNLAWVLYHMAEDEIYHRGQISMIRKLYAEARE